MGDDGVCRAKEEFLGILQAILLYGLARDATDGVGTVLDAREGCDDIVVAILKVFLQKNPATKRWSEKWVSTGSGWSSSGGGWSSGGGGFSGGGGSFSGGGSSGSW